ncbi:MAG: hypothetical protein N2Z22_12175, partial [Turneriella sp.]|nr:hypothetical protein [Turneriella sp.]
MKNWKKLLAIFALMAYAVACARGGKTQFTRNLEADAGKPAPTYEEWVALIGQEKADLLYAGIGQDSLDLLSYGIGVSNMVQLINAITDGSKLVTLIGNDSIAGTGPGGFSGLGAVITIYLLKSVDTQLQANLSSNLVGGGAPPTDQDTIANLASVINTLSGTEIQTKLVDLFGAAGFNLSRSLAVNSGGRTPAEQQLIVNRMSRIVAQVDNTAPACTKICSLLTNLSAADVTSKMSAMITYNLAAGINFANKLVETIETTTAINRPRAVISST